MSLVKKWEESFLHGGKRPYDDPPPPTPSPPSMNLVASPPPAVIRPDAHPLGPALPRRTELRSITPDQARAVLADWNGHNRRKTPRVSDAVASALRAGHWEVNGETIIFADDGNLLDGQNRLEGCVKSGLVLTTYVVFGIDPRAFGTIDRGRSRDLSCDLSIDGYQDVTVTASVVRVTKAYLDGCRTTTIFNRFSQCDSRDYIEFLAANPELVESVRFGRSHRQLPITPRILGSFHFLAGRKSASRRDEFFDLFVSGAGLDQGSPILALRHRLYQDRDRDGSRKRHAAGQDAAFTTFSAVIRAWNHWRKGTSVGKIQVPTHQNSAGRIVLDPLPEIL